MKTTRSLRPLLAVACCALLLAWSASAQGSGVRLDAVDTTTLTIDQGTAEDVRFRVTNENVVTERRVTMAVDDGPAGWAFTFEPQSLTIAPGATNVTRLTVAVPADAATGEHAFRVRAHDATTGFAIGDAVPVNVTVAAPTPPSAETSAPEPRLDLVIDRATTQAEPGDAVANRVLLTVTDAPNGVAVRFAVALPAGWPASSASGLPGERLLYSDRYEFPFTITVPESAPANETHRLTVTATRGDATVQAAFDLRVLPKAPAPQPNEATPNNTSANTTDPGPKQTTDPASSTPGAIILTLEPASMTVPRTDYGRGVLTIENTGDEPKSIALTADTPPGWTVNFDQAQTALVPPRGSLSLDFTVLAPATAEPGETANLLVRAGDASAPLALRVAAPDAPVPDENAAAPLDADSTVQETPQEATAKPRLSVIQEGPALAVAAGAVVASGGVALAAGTPARRRHLWWLAVGAYTRLTRPKLLDHPERERLFRSIEAKPGVHFHALQRQLGWNTGALTYHLRVLERHQLITSRRDGILRRFYLVGTAPKAMPTATTPSGDKIALSGLRGNVLTTVRERGRIPQAALAAELGASKQTVNYHVKTLERIGLLNVERVGRDTVLSPAADEAPTAAPAAFGR